MTLEEMRQKRTELGLSYQQIAASADMPLSTVQKIFGGITKAPRQESLLKIQQVLIREEQRLSSDSHPSRRYRFSDSGDLFVRERGFLYGAAGAEKLPGDYTIEDYYALPDEHRVELIDGVFYDMSAPSSPHQLIAGEIHTQLLSFRKSRKASCMPMIAPVDVQLDRDAFTMVQPDVMILCDKSKLIRRCVYGAPDFIAEVLSPSTRKKDMTLKLHKYSRAGVREYWLIDPDQQRIVVYDLEHDELPVIYGFDAAVPVRIWGGACQVDFTEVRDTLAEWVQPDPTD